MHIERDSDGNFILDATELAPRFELSIDEFRRNTQRGLVASTVEIGTETEAGMCRLSLRIGNRVWRATLDQKDDVVAEAVNFVGKLTKRDPHDSATDPVSTAID